LKISYALKECFDSRFQLTCISVRVICCNFQEGQNMFFTEVFADPKGFDAISMASLQNKVDDHIRLETVDHDRQCIQTVLIRRHATAGGSANSNRPWSRRGRPSSFTPIPWPGGPRRKHQRIADPADKVRYVPIFPQAGRACTDCWRHLR
jgi:hypothetical protein